MPATRGDSQSSWPTPAVLLLEIKCKIICGTNKRVRWNKGGEGSLSLKSRWTGSRWRRWSPLVESLPPQPEKPRQGLTWEVTMTVRMSWQPMLSKAWPTTWQRGVLCRLQDTSAAGCKRCSNLGTNQMSFLLPADQVIRFQEIIALPYTRLKLQHLSCDHRVGEVPGSYHSSHADWLSKQGWSPDLIKCFGKRLNLGCIYRMKIISLVLVGLAATSPPILRASSLKGKNNEDDFQLLFKKVQGNTWTTR